MNIDKNLILLNQKIDDKMNAVVTAGKLLVDHGLVEKEYISKMLDREESLSTYVGNLIAIPHGSEGSDSLINKSGISIVQIPDGVSFDGNEVKVVFGIAGKDGSHLEMLSQIAVFATEIENVIKIVNAKNKEEIINMLIEK